MAVDYQSPPALLHILSSNRWGGVERYALDICRHFKEKDWHVAVVTRDARAVDKFFENSAIPIMHAPLMGVSDPSSLFALSQIIKKQPAGAPLIIHVHRLATLIIALMAKKISRRPDVRIIMTRHTVKKGLDSWLLRKVYQNIDSLIFVSEHAKKRFFSTWAKGVEPFSLSQLNVIHNSLNLPEPDMETETPPKTGPVTAMFHGPLRNEKGLETLIDALSILKGTKLRLRIVGSGSPDYTDRLRRRALNRGVMDNIDWHGQTDNPIQLIKNSSFGVLPSLKEEAFGLANIEYMVCGKPQVCSSNGAQPEYITDGREGFLIPPGNPVVLAEAMKKLANDADLRLRMGERAFKTFNEKLSWNNFITKIEKIYCP